MSNEERPTFAEQVEAALATGRNEIKFNVYATTTASASVTVEVDRSVIDACRGDESESAGELLADRLREEIIERTYDEGFPSLCARCSGYGRSYSLDLDDEWDVLDGDDGIDLAR